MFTSAYNAAADHYDHPANSYWERFSVQTLERLAPRAGARMLDAGCGTGAFSIPAAIAVGATGEVVGVDLAANLLALARRKTAQRGLHNVTFMEADAFAIEDPRGFDGVVSVFSVFFAPDMIGAVRHLWKLVRPGGILAVTTWGPSLFEPAASVFWRSVAGRRPDLRCASNPWERVNHPEALHAIISSAGVPDVRVDAEGGQHMLDSPEDWWRIVNGSGFRGTVDALTAPEQAFVRDEVIERLRRDNVRAIRTDTVYAICRKP